MKRSLLSLCLTLAMGALVCCKKNKKDPEPTGSSAVNSCVEVLSSENGYQSYCKYENNHIVYQETSYEGIVAKAEYSYNGAGILSKFRLDQDGEITVKNYTIQNDKITGFATEGKVYPYGVYYYTGDFVSAEVIRKSASEKDSIVYTRNSEGFVTSSVQYNATELVAESSFMVDSYGQKIYEDVQWFYHGSLSSSREASYIYSDVKNPTSSDNIVFFGFDPDLSGFQPGAHNKIYLLEEIDYTATHGDNSSYEYEITQEITMDGDKVSGVKVKEYKSGALDNEYTNSYSYNCK